MAVSRALIPHLPALAIRRPGKGARRFTIGFLLGLLFVSAALIGFRQAFVGRIMPGVLVGDVDVGSMTPEAARAALAQRYGPLENGTVVINSSRGSTVIPFDRLGRMFDFDEMVNRAVAVGRGGSQFDETMFGLRLLAKPQALGPLVDFDRAHLSAELAAYSDRLRVEPLDAAVTNSPTGLALWPSVDGVSVDASSLVAPIEAALLEPTAAADVVMTADVVAVAPKITNDEAVRARDLAEKITADLLLTNGSKTWTIPAARIRTWITFGSTDEGYLPTIDPRGVPDSLSKVRKGVLRHPREATYLKDRSGHVLGVAASGAGEALDVQATAQAVIDTLEGRATGADSGEMVELAMVPVAPKFNTAEAVKNAPLMVMVGSWTTRYQVSAHNGFAANITVPARRLNGVVVRPGQTFDFWNALGEVSFRTGYRLGGAIVGGHSVEGTALAGGICAASTTLFNAAARGGYDIVKRAPHWYYIKRYPVGLDATVSESQDMRFRNDTRYPILIRGFASPGMVRFEIWSVPNGRKVTWTRPSISNVVRGYDTVQKTSSLPPGKRKRIEWPVDGMDVSVRRTVREVNGNIVSSDLFVSHYHRMVGVTLVGK
jgi:vancomycin resistance protein YoaR